MLKTVTFELCQAQKQLLKRVFINVNLYSRTISNAYTMGLLLLSGVHNDVKSGRTSWSMKRLYMQRLNFPMVGLLLILCIR